MKKDINVLYLDDDHDSLGVFNKIFDQEPFGVFSTDNPDKALEILRKEQIKVAVSDQVMPKMKGTQFLQEVLNFDSHIERILLTSHHDFAVAEEADNILETYRVIIKPWKGADLLRGVRRAIERYDLTKKVEQTNELLQRMYVARAEFTSIVSHELRTPLASIKTAIDLVFKKILGPINVEQEEVLGRAKRNVDRLKRLIDDILDLAKMEAGKLNMNLAMNDVRRVVEEVVETHKDMAKTRGLYIKTGFDNVPDIMFDHDRITQVLNNIFSNAIKFTKQGGLTAKVINKSKEDNVLISISDTGKGIAEDNIPKLFDKFYQVESIQQNEEGGTGLGLAICKEIISKHQGKIWVESVLEKGTSFYIALPISVQDPRP